MSSDSSPLALRSACERLARSRQRLQEALCELAPAARMPTAAPTGALAGLLANLQSLPGASLLMQVAQAWWAKHPYRVATIALAELAKATVAPTAQRHPWGLVAGAFALGGLLVWSRPWRWLTPAVMSGLVPR